MGQQAAIGRTTVMAYLAAGFALACRWGPGPDGMPSIEGRNGERGAGRPSAPGASPTATEVYREMGLLVHGADFPVVGRLSYLAAPTADSTTVVLTLAFPATALTFTRDEPGRFVARYRLTADVVRDSVVAHRIAADERVAMASYRETTRGGELVLFQETFRLAPGPHTLSVALHDASSTRTALLRRPIDVPQLGDGAISSPMPVLRGGTRATLAEPAAAIANPRATYTFGEDSVVPVQVEAYGAAPQIALRADVRTDGGTVIWSDTVALERRGSAAGLTSGTVRIPVDRLSIGRATLTVTRLDDPVRAGSAAELPLFVSFGADLPVASYDAMVDYLRWFTAPARVARLREAPPARRAEAWTEFLRATDPDPTTAEHEGLREYFRRIDLANQRFRGEQGWRSDRGRVLVALGEPDVIHDDTRLGGFQSGQRLSWEYRQLGVRLVFEDPTGFGSWRLAPEMEAEFLSAFALLHGE